MSDVINVDITVASLTGSSGIVTVPNGTSLNIGSTPSTAGVINLTLNDGIYSRNNGNGADILLIKLDSTNGNDDLILGELGGHSVHVHMPAFILFDNQSSPSCGVYADSSGVQIGSTSGTDFSGGDGGMLGLTNCGNPPPGGNPNNGGVLYVDSGALYFMGSSGTVTMVAPA